MNSLPKINIQTESSDCAFAALSTLLESYYPGRAVNSIDLRNRYGEGPNGISLSGFIRLLDKIGFKYDVAEYSYGAISANPGLYFAMEADGQSGHITILASLKDDKYIWRADMLTGRWSKLDAAYSASKYIVIVREAGLSPMASADKQKTGSSWIAGRSLFTAITIYSLPGLLPWIIPFLVVASGTPLAESSKFNSTLPLLTILLIGCSRILTGWAGSRAFARLKVKWERKVLSSLWRKPLDFFTQRSLWDVDTYIQDASQVANFFGNTIQFEVGYGFALSASALVLFLYFPITVSVIISGYVLLVVLSSDLLYVFLERLREEERIVAGTYSMHYVAGLINPLGAFYSRRNPAEASRFIELAERAAKGRAKSDNYENLIQSVRSVLVVGMAFGIAHLLTQHIALDIAWTGRAQMLYPFIMSLSIVGAMFSDARYLHKRESLAKVRVQTLIASQERDSFSIPYAPSKAGKPFRIAVVGKNGSGKSTFLKNIAGLTVKGKDCLGADLLDHSFIKNMLKVVEKERDILYLNSTFVPLGITAGEALASADESFKSKELFKRSFTKLSLDSVPHIFDRQIYSGFSALSTGEAQRLALLFSLVSIPKILILDETLSAVPHAERKDLLNYLNTELKDSILIYVDHNNDSNSLGFWTHVLDMDSCMLRPVAADISSSGGVI